MPSGSHPDEFALSPGETLRRLRRIMRFSLREVHQKTRLVADYFDNEEFIISITRLSEIETTGAVPNIYRLSSLSIVYDIQLSTILSWYGVDIDDALVRRKLKQK